MSLFDYEVGKKVAQQDYPFYALIMAAYRKADTENQIKLEAMWPDVIAELKMRYNNPRGMTNSELAKARAEGEDL